MEYLIEALAKQLEQHYVTFQTVPDPDDEQVHLITTSLEKITIKRVQSKPHYDGTCDVRFFLIDCHGDNYEIKKTTYRLLHNVLQNKEDITMSAIYEGILTTLENVFNKIDFDKCE